MSRLKKIMLTMFSVFVMFGGVLLSACGQNTNKANIVLSSTNVQIVLGEEDNKATVRATVTNSNALDVVVDKDSLDIDVSSTYIGDGVTEITVEAYRKCKNVEVTVHAQGSSATFFVSATNPVQAIEAKKDVHYLAYDKDASDYGSVFKLSSDLFTIKPIGDTDQTEVKYSLSKEYFGVTIDNGYLRLAKDISDDHLPKDIYVDVVSIYNDAVKATLHFEVVKKIDINKISIYDGKTLAPADKVYEIIRNDPTMSQDSVVIQIVVPFSVYDKQMNVTPIFKFNDAGIQCDTSNIERDENNRVYRYTFNFKYDASTQKDGSGKMDQVWFEIAYKEIPEVKTSTLTKFNGEECTGIITLKIIDELTGITVGANGEIVTGNSFDVYTKYKTDLDKGLELQFSAYPLDATSQDFVLLIDANDINLPFMTIRNEKGDIVQFVEGRYEFTGGEKFYFKATSGFAENASLKMTVASTKNAEITRTITLHLQEGITDFGFYVNNELRDNVILYLENNKDSNKRERVITFGATPVTVNANKFKVIVEGDVFTSDGIITLNTKLPQQNKVKYCDVNISAVVGKTGQGKLIVRFESGQEISATIKVISKLDDFKIDVDTSENVSSAIGDIKYAEEGRVSYIAIKNGHSLSIKYDVGDAKILGRSYKFADRIYVPEDNVYDPNSDYSTFGKDPNVNGDGTPVEYKDFSQVVRAELLRTTRSIVPVTVGKVLIQVIFKGERLNDSFEYSEIEISQYVCIEIYNPVESIYVSQNKVELYAFDEVGKSNEDKSKTVIEVELNKNSANKPTYGNIFWEGKIVDKIHPYIYVPAGTEVEVLKIENIENGKYLLSVNTRKIPDAEPISFHSITVSAADITGGETSWSKEINVLLKEAILVNDIKLNNVSTYKNKKVCEHCHQIVDKNSLVCPICGNDMTLKSDHSDYYINLVSTSVVDDISENSFKILSTVYPENSLNKKVVYEFIPDTGVKNNIVTFSEDGVVSVQGSVGGSGIIKVVPQDSVLEDHNGNRVYRQDAPVVIIRLIVADGLSKETSILIHDQTEFDTLKDPSLHYTLVYGTYTLTQPLFVNSNDSVFEGGLYGQDIYSDNKAIIVLQNTSLFKVISLSGVVEDLIVYGTTSESGVVYKIRSMEVNVDGLICAVNKGTIRNVTIDSDYENLTASSVKTSYSLNYGNGYVGGITGINIGLIDNSSFSGIVSNPSATIGGIAGMNTGIIVNTAVIMYNVKNGGQQSKDSSNLDQMRLEGSLVGGLVGEIYKDSKEGAKVPLIEKSYIYNFSDSNPLAADTFAGGLVGRILSKGTLIKECFAQIGVISEFYSALPVDEVSSEGVEKTIKDSYVLYKDPANNKTIGFNYYMTDIYGSYIHDKIKSPNATFNNVSFSSRDVWNITDGVNNNYPYLNKVRPVEAVTNINKLSIQKTNLSQQESGETAIIYFYKVKDRILNDREKKIVDNANTLSFAELFEIENTNGIVVTSTNPNIISTTLNSITTRGVGSCQLKVRSKYDLMIDEKTINICVLYYTSSIDFYIGNTKLTGGATINVRKGKTQKISSYLDNEIVLNGESVYIHQNDYTVNFKTFVENPDQNVADNPDKFIEVDANMVTGNKIGTHVVYGEFTDIKDKIDLNVYLSLDLSNYKLTADTLKKVQEMIKKGSSRAITISQIKGPTKITSSISKAEISASDDLSVEISVTYDEFDKNEGLIYTVYDQKGSLAPNILTIKKLSTSNNSIKKVDGSTTNIDKVITSYIYVISVDRSNLVQSVNNTYTVRFATSDINIYYDIDIKVLPQEVIRINVNNYAQKGTEKDGTVYNFYPGNVIIPGSSSLLDITLYPSYADFTNIDITCNSINGQVLSLVNMRKGIAGKDNESEKAFYVDSASNSEFIENGVRIFKEAYKDNTPEIARYYIRVVAPTSVVVDTTYRISINVYNGNSITYTQTYDMVVVPQQKPGLSVDGENKIFALLGDKLIVDIVKTKTQTLSPTYYVSNKNAATAVFNNDWISLDARNEKATFTLYISNDLITDFIFEVQVSEMINGKEEITKSSILVYIIPFELDIENTHLKNNEGSDTIVGDTYFKSELDFAFAGKYNFAGQAIFERFLENGFFKDDIYEINGNARADENPFKQNLYFVNGNSYSPVTNGKGSEFVEIEFAKPDNIGKERIFFIGKALGDQKMLLEIPVTMPDNTSFVYKYFFTISIKAELNDDEPVQINNATEFLAIFENKEPEHYILMRNILLFEYTPVKDTSKMESLDGNGFSISIMSYAYDEKVNLSNFALFQNVSENTTIKNLRVNVYNINEIVLKSSSVAEANIASVAINNFGVITNTEVVSYRSNNASDIIPIYSGLNVVTESTIGITAKTAGFVVNNFGIITNSRVGGERITEYTVNKSYGTVLTKTIELKPFEIRSFGEVAGFVHTNTGHITSSFVNNVKIINSSETDYSTLTAGFALFNQGVIQMSYVKGVKARATDVHATAAGIETSGIAAGFAYLNSKLISDCYSNITLTNLNNPGRSSSGFVYINKEGARIEKSLSLSRIVKSTTTQMNFIGVNERGEYQNKGSVENSYYYDAIAQEDDSILIEKAYGQSAKEVGSVVIKDYFYGFNFTTAAGYGEDGIWYMTQQGPDLVSANNKTVSLRYTSKESAQGKPKTKYVEQYSYGSKNNPILIRDANQFNEVFNSSVNKSSSRFLNSATKEAFGSYRLINNIDFKELATQSETYRLLSSELKLTGSNSSSGNKESIGKFDGNGFTIKGFALGDTSTVGSSENFGMFAEVVDGAIVMNLDIVLGATNKENEIFGIEAKNITNVGSLAGTVRDSKVVNIDVRSLYENTNSVTVSGRNIVGGIIGKVVGNSYISNIIATDISVSAVHYPELETSENYPNYNKFNRFDNTANKNVSYAGGLIGVFDAYSEETKNEYKFSNTIISSNSNGIVLKTKGVMQISGGTVGGIAGMIGPLTTVQDALVDLAYVEDDSMQGFYAYNAFAGGITGVNFGYLRQVRSEYNNTKKLEQFNNLTYQQEIERGMITYYKASPEDKANYERGNEQLFNKDKYYPIAMGGLVGLQVSGKIEKSYSKLNVINTNNANIGYAGGIIGAVAKTDSLVTALIEVYASGDVYANIGIGGIVGYEDGSAKATSYEKVNAVNYWGLALDKKITFANSFTAGKATDVKNSTSRNMFSDLKSKNLIEEETEDKFITTYKYKFNEQAVVAPYYTDMTDINLASNGEMFDKIFKGNSWDGNSWFRSKGELFPHILFGYHSNIIYIRNQYDLEKLRTNDEDAAGNITFVIAPDESNYPEDSTEDVKLITIDRKIAPIVGFCNTIREKDNKFRYGFDFVGKNQTKALFKSTMNATFSNFDVYYNFADGGKNQFVNTTSQGGAFVEIAHDTTFLNMNFNGITMTNNSSGKVTCGIVTAVAQGSTSFSGITFTDCKIELNGNNGIADAGLLFGSAMLTKEGGISNITFNNSKIVIKNHLGKFKDFDDKTQSNIGTMGGKLTNIDPSKEDKMTVVVCSKIKTDNDNGENKPEGGDGGSSGDGGETSNKSDKDLKADENKDKPSKPKPKPNPNLKGGFYAEINAYKEKDSTDMQIKPIITNANIGTLFGTLENVDIIGSIDNNPKEKAIVKLKLNEIVNVNVGGLVGLVKNSDVKTINVLPNIEVFKTIDSNIGGLIGYANDINYEDIKIETQKPTDEEIAQNKQAKLNEIKIHQVYEGIQRDVNVGSLSGCMINNTQTYKIQHVKSYITIDLTAQIDDVNPTISEIVMGGLVGYAEKAMLYDCSNYGDIKIFNKDGSMDATIGGLIGYGKYVTFAKLAIPNDNTTTKSTESENIEYLYNYAVGNIMNCIASHKTEQESGLNSLTVGGILGVGYENIIMEGCVAAGNTYPMYRLAQKGELGNPDKPEVIESKSMNLQDLEDKNRIKLGFFNYGGLIGSIEEAPSSNPKLVLTENISIDTLYNKAGALIIKVDGDDKKLGDGYTVNGLASKYQANAFVGYDGRSLSKKGKDSITGNTYSHIYTLVHDDNGIQSIANGKSSNKKLSEISDKVADVVNRDKYFTNGSKILYEEFDVLSYNPGETSDILIKDKYVYLPVGLDIDVPRTIKLVNSVFVSDGGTMMLDSLKYKKKLVFSEIDDNSVVAGIIVKSSYVDGASTMSLAGFAQTNKGIVFTSNVRGKGENGQKITGFLRTNALAAGFIVNNFGYIKDCFTDMQVVTNATYGNPTTGSGFVLSNSGFIESSYATGALICTSPDATASAFSAESSESPTSGVVLNSYSIVKLDVVDLSELEEGNSTNDTEKKHKVFGKNHSENSFYDKYGIEFEVFGDSAEDGEDKVEPEYGKVTDLISIGKNNSGKVDDINLIYNSETNSIKSKLKADINYAYGYGSFYDPDGLYKEMDYMVHPTGTGKSADHAFQIPNLGKLLQIESIVDKVSDTRIYYRITQDINGKYITDIKSDSTPPISSLNINNIEIDAQESVFSGGSHIIKNINIKNGGLFGTIENSIVKNIKVKNILVGSISINDTKPEAIVGLFANELKGEKSIISNIVLETKSNFMTKIKIKNSNTKETGKLVIGMVIGQVIEGIVSDCNIKIEGIKGTSLDVTNNDIDYTINIEKDTSMKSINWTIGGIIGRLVGGSAANLKLNDSTFSIDFENAGNNRVNKTYNIGGIVGEQTGGKITGSVLDSDVSAFVKDVKYESNSGLILNIGGIVGYISTSNTDADVTECVTQQGSHVRGGNNYLFSEVYAAGISGKGGHILRCKNRADVTSRAIYQYVIEKVDKDTKEHTTKYSKSNDLIVELDSMDKTDRDRPGKPSLNTTYPSYSIYNQDQGHVGSSLHSLFKFIYATLRQEAHSAGIANEYEKIEKCLNYSKKITGGMESKNIHSYNSIDYGKVLGISIGMNYAFETSKNAIIAGVATAFVTLGAGLVIAGAGIAGILGTYFGAKSIPVEITRSYMPGNGYIIDGGEHIFIPEIEYYFKNAYQATMNPFPTSSDVYEWVDFLTTMNHGPYQTKHDWNIPYGYADYKNGGMLTVDQLKGFATQDMRYFSNLNYNENIGFYSTDLKINDVFYDTLGLSSTGTKVDSYSAYQVFTEKPITIGSANYKGYLINDNCEIPTTTEGVTDSLSNLYKIVYISHNATLFGSDASNAKTLTREETNLLTGGNLNGITDDKKDVNGENTPVWEFENGEWNVVSVENTKANLDDVFKDPQKFKIEDSKVPNKKNIIFNISDMQEYNLLLELANKDIDKLQRKYANIQSAEAFKNLINALKNLDGFHVSILQDLDGITTGLGTSSRPFSGILNGVSVTGELIRLTGVKHNSAFSATGLINYADTVSVQNLSIEYSERNSLVYSADDKGADSKSIKTAGGIVGQLQNGGQLDVTNVSLSYYFKNYILDSRFNVEASISPINVGGYVGSIIEGAKVTIKEKDNQPVNIKNIVIEEKTLLDKIDSPTSIGGFVGEIKNGSFVIESSYLEVENLKINTSSSASYVGGFIGSINNPNPENSVVIRSSVVLNGYISVETHTNEAIAGGVIGKIYKGGISLEYNSVSLVSIIAKSAVESTRTYVGGAIGYVSSSSENINIGNYTIGENKKVLLISGVGGKVYPVYAYANKVVGNNGTIDASDTSKTISYGTDLGESKVKCYAIAKPDYSKVSETSSLKPINDTPRVKFFRQEIDDNSNLANFFTVNVYEFPTQIYRPAKDVNNAKVDEESFVAYNYQKQYLISTIYMTKADSPDPKEKKPCYDHKENYYLLTINGGVGQFQDRDMEDTYVFEHIASSAYIADIPMYMNYSETSYPYSSLKHTNTGEFVAGYYPAELKDHIMYLQCSGENGSKDEQGNSLLEGTSSLEKGTIKNNLNTELNALNGISKDYARLNYSFANTSIQGLKCEIEKLENGMPNGIRLKLEIGGTEEVVMFFKNVYTVGEKNDSKADLQYTLFNSYDSSDISNVSKSEVYISLPKVKNKPANLPLDLSPLYTENKPYKIDVMLSNVFKIDGNDKEKRRVLVLSKTKGGVPSQTSPVEFTDHIYMLVGTAFKVFDLGTITYETTIGQQPNRTRFFFPADIEEKIYSNDLYSLDKENVIEVPRRFTEVLTSTKETIKTYLELDHKASTPTARFHLFDNKIETKYSIDIEVKGADIDTVSVDILKSEAEPPVETTTPSYIEQDKEFLDIITQNSYKVQSYTYDELNRDHTLVLLTNNAEEGKRLHTFTWKTNGADEIEDQIREYVETYIEEEDPNNPKPEDPNAPPPPEPMKPEENFYNNKGELLSYVEKIEGKLWVRVVKGEDETITYYKFSAEQGAPEYYIKGDFIFEEYVAESPEEDPGAPPGGPDAPGSGGAENQEVKFQARNKYAVGEGVKTIVFSDTPKHPVISVTYIQKVNLLGYGNTNVYITERFDNPSIEIKIKTGTKKFLYDDLGLGISMNVCHEDMKQDFMFVTLGKEYNAGINLIEMTVNINKNITTRYITLEVQKSETENSNPGEDTPEKLMIYEVEVTTDVKPEGQDHELYAFVIKDKEDDSKYFHVYKYYDNSYNEFNVVGTEKSSQSIFQNMTRITGIEYNENQNIEISYDYMDSGTSEISSKSIIVDTLSQLKGNIFKTVDTSRTVEKSQDWDINEKVKFTIFTYLTKLRIIVDDTKTSVKELIVETGNISGDASIEWLRPLGSDTMVKITYTTADTSTLVEDYYIISNLIQVKVKSTNFYKKELLLFGVVKGDVYVYENDVTYKTPEGGDVAIKESIIKINKTYAADPSKVETEITSNIEYRDADGNKTGDTPIKVTRSYEQVLDQPYALITDNVILNPDNVEGKPAREEKTSVMEVELGMRTFRFINSTSVTFSEDPLYGANLSSQWSSHQVKYIIEGQEAKQELFDIKLK